MKVRDENDKRFGRDVQNVLRSEEVGIRHADQIGPVLELEYLDSRAPVRVKTSLRETPSRVSVLLAKDLTDPTQGFTSDARVRWSWTAGDLSILDIDVPTPANTYLVTLGVWR